MPTQPRSPRWLKPGEDFPSIEFALDSDSGAPGLLAVGGDLTVGTLQRAYSSAIFPWFSDGQPILWWSPDPRMVLQVANFRLHRSLRKVLMRFTQDTRCEVRFNTAFADVIRACANASRLGQAGTWILPEMVQAYTRLHEAGNAHSVETWIDGKLVGGLYCVALGRAVFGESMFTRQPDASKIALSALTAFSRHNGITMVDCQQNTPHLASLGAAEMPRSAFLEHIRHSQYDASVDWHFAPLYWNHILSA